VNNFEARITRASTIDDHFDALEALMLERFAGKSGIHPCVQRALTIVEQTGGQIRISELASRCRVSTRHLANLLRTWVGLSPKTLARVTRFQKFLEQMETEPAESGAARAADLGYFDQAHLTREVSRFFGATPGSVSPNQVADFSKTRCE
jgi:methylphosphotriester-DNA--protein-cysteine methyltransferase